ncbi:MAG TPA: DUF819 family protein, partial [Candidatus Limnocylindrales bacterium]|nr:DUF819 family protein [Candidatus Limnocylindrales bacterium]
MMFFWIAFFVLVPALVIYLCHKFSALNKLGPVIICYAVGILVGNIGILPENIFGTQNTLMTLVIPIAIPLIFFSVEIKRWFTLAGKSLLSFAFVVLSVVIAVSASYFLFRPMIGEETWKISGMLIGVYTGGTPNLAAIGTALRVDPTLYMAAHSADVAIGGIWLLIVITVLQRLLLKFLPPFQRVGGESQTHDVADFESYAGIFQRKVIMPLLGALGIAVGIFAIGGGLTFVVPEEFAMVVAILTVSTLGIACSFIPKIRRIPMTFQLGQYFILIFCLVVSSMANIEKLLQTAPAMLGMVAFAYLFTIALHVAFAAIARIDTDTVIITSVAGIYSPPFVPMVAAALKNKEVIVSGFVTGIIGWVIGT